MNFAVATLAIIFLSYGAIVSVSEAAKEQADREPNKFASSSIVLQHARYCKRVPAGYLAEVHGTVLGDPAQRPCLVFSAAAKAGRGTPFLEGLIRSNKTEADGHLGHQVELRHVDIIADGRAPGGDLLDLLLGPPGDSKEDPILARLTATVDAEPLARQHPPPKPPLAGSGPEASATSKGQVPQSHGGQGAPALDPGLSTPSDPDSESGSGRLRLWLTSCRVFFPLGAAGGSDVGGALGAGLGRSSRSDVYDVGDTSGAGMGRRVSADGDLGGVSRLRPSGYGSDQGRAVACRAAALYALGGGGGGGSGLMGIIIAAAAETAAPRAMPEADTFGAITAGLYLPSLYVRSRRRVAAAAADGAADSTGARGDWAGQFEGDLGGPAWDQSAPGKENARVARGGQEVRGPASDPNAGAPSAHPDLWDGRPSQGARTTVLDVLKPGVEMETEVELEVQVHLRDVTFVCYTPRRRVGIAGDGLGYGGGNDAARLCGDADRARNGRDAGGGCGDARATASGLGRAVRGREVSGGEASGGDANQGTMISRMSSSSSSSGINRRLSRALAAADVTPTLNHAARVAGTDPDAQLEGLGPKLLAGAAGSAAPAPVPWWAAAAAATTALPYAVALYLAATVTAGCLWWRRRRRPEASTTVVGAGGGGGGQQLRRHLQQQRSHPDGLAAPEVAGPSLVQLVPPTASTTITTNNAMMEEGDAANDGGEATLELLATITDTISDAGGGGFASGVVPHSLTVPGRTATAVGPDLASTASLLSRAAVARATAPGGAGSGRRNSSTAAAATAGASAGDGAGGGDGDPNTSPRRSSSGFVSVALLGPPGCGTVAGAVASGGYPSRARAPPGGPMAATAAGGSAAACAAAATAAAWGRVAQRNVSRSDSLFIVESASAGQDPSPPRPSPPMAAASSALQGCHITPSSASGASTANAAAATAGSGATAPGSEAAGSGAMTVAAAAAAAGTNATTARTSSSRVAALARGYSGGIGSGSGECGHVLLGTSSGYGGGVGAGLLAGGCLQHQALVSPGGPYLNGRGTSFPTGGMNDILYSTQDIPECPEEEEKEADTGFDQGLLAGGSPRDGLEPSRSSLGGSATGAAAAAVAAAAAAAAAVSRPFRIRGLRRHASAGNGFLGSEDAAAAATAAAAAVDGRGSTGGRVGADGGGGVETLPRLYGTGYGGPGTTVPGMAPCTGCLSGCRDGGDAAADRPSQLLETLMAVPALEAAGGKVTAKDVVIDTNAVLGRGTYSTTYRGRWRGMDVAVKVILYDRSASRKQQAETLPCGLPPHPHVLQLHQHIYVQRPTSIRASSSASLASAGCLAAQGPPTGAAALGFQVSKLDPPLSSPPSSDLHQGGLSSRSLSPLPYSQHRLSAADAGRSGGSGNGGVVRGGALITPQLYTSYGAPRSMPLPTAPGGLRISSFQQPTVVGGLYFSPVTSSNTAGAAQTDLLPSPFGVRHIHQAFPPGASTLKSQASSLLSQSTQLFQLPQEYGAVANASGSSIGGGASLVSELMLHFAHSGCVGAGAAATDGCGSSTDGGRGRGSGGGREGRGAASPSAGVGTGGGGSSDLNSISLHCAWIGNLGAEETTETTPRTSAAAAAAASARAECRTYGPLQRPSPGQLASFVLPGTETTVNYQPPTEGSSGRPRRDPALLAKWDLLTASTTVDPTAAPTANCLPGDVSGTLAPGYAPEYKARRTTDRFDGAAGDFATVEGTQGAPSGGTEASFRGPKSGGDCRGPTTDKHRSPVATGFTFLSSAARNNITPVLDLGVRLDPPRPFEPRFLSYNSNGQSFEQISTPTASAGAPRPVSSVAAMTAVSTRSPDDISFPQRDASSSVCGGGGGLPNHAASSPAALPDVVLLSDEDRAPLAESATVAATVSATVVAAAASPGAAAATAANISTGTAPIRREPLEPADVLMSSPFSTVDAGPSQPSTSLSTSSSPPAQTPEGTPRRTLEALSQPQPQLPPQHRPQQQQPPTAEIQRRQLTVVSQELPPPPPCAMRLRGQLDRDLMARPGKTLDVSTVDASHAAVTSRRAGAFKLRIPGGSGSGSGGGSDGPDGLYGSRWGPVSSFIQTLPLSPRGQRRFRDSASGDLAGFEGVGGFRGFAGGQGTSRRCSVGSGGGGGASSLLTPQRVSPSDWSSLGFCAGGAISELYPAPSTGLGDSFVALDRVPTSNLGLDEFIERMAALPPSHHSEPVTSLLSPNREQLGRGQHASTRAGAVSSLRTDGGGSPPGAATDICGGGGGIVVIGAAREPPPVAAPVSVSALADVSLPALFVEDPDEAGHEPSWLPPPPRGQVSPSPLTVPLPAAEPALSSPDPSTSAGVPMSIPALPPHHPSAASNAVQEGSGGGGTTASATGSATIAFATDVAPISEVPVEDTTSRFSLPSFSGKALPGVGIGLTYVSTGGGGGVGEGGGGGNDPAGESSGTLCGSIDMRTITRRQIGGGVGGGQGVAGPSGVDKPTTGDHDVFRGGGLFVVGTMRSGRGSGTDSEEDDDGTGGGGGGGSGSGDGIDISRSWQREWKADVAAPLVVPIAPTLDPPLPGPSAAGGTVAKATAASVLARFGTSGSVTTPTHGSGLSGRSSSGGSCSASANGGSAGTGLKSGGRSGIHFAVGGRSGGSGGGSEEGPSLISNVDWDSVLAGIARRSSGEGGGGAVPGFAPMGLMATSANGGGGSGGRCDRWPDTGGSTRPYLSPTAVRTPLLRLAPPPPPPLSVPLVGSSDIDTSLTSPRPAVAESTGTRNGGLEWSCDNSGGGGSGGGGQSPPAVSPPLSPSPDHLLLPGLAAMAAGRAVNHVAPHRRSHSFQTRFSTPRPRSRLCLHTVGEILLSPYGTRTSCRGMPYRWSALHPDGSGSGSGLERPDGAGGGSGGGVVRGVSFGGGGEGGGAQGGRAGDMDMQEMDGHHRHNPGDGTRTHFPRRSGGSCTALRDTVLSPTVRPRDFCSDPSLAAQPVAPAGPTAAAPVPAGESYDADTANEEAPGRGRDSVALVAIGGGDLGVGRGSRADGATQGHTVAKPGSMTLLPTSSSLPVRTLTHQVPASLTPSASNAHLVSSSAATSSVSATSVSRASSPAVGAGGGRPVAGLAPQPMSSTSSTEVEVEVGVLTPSGSCPLSFEPWGEGGGGAPAGSARTFSGGGLAAAGVQVAMLHCTAADGGGDSSGGGSGNGGVIGGGTAESGAAQSDAAKELPPPTTDMASGSAAAAPTSAMMARLRVWAASGGSASNDEVRGSGYEAEHTGTAAARSVQVNHVVVQEAQSFDVEMLSLPDAANVEASSGPSSSWDGADRSAPASAIRSKANGIDGGGGTAAASATRAAAAVPYMACVSPFIVQPSSSSRRPVSGAINTTTNLHGRYDRSVSQQLPAAASRRPPHHSSSGNLADGWRAPARAAPGAYTAAAGARGGSSCGRGASNEHLAALVATAGTAPHSHSTRSYGVPSTCTLSASASAGLPLGTPLLDNAAQHAPPRQAGSFVGTADGRTYTQLLDVPGLCGLQEAGRLGENDAASVSASRYSGGGGSGRMGGANVVSNGASSTTALPRTPAVHTPSSPSTPLEAIVSPKLVASLASTTTGDTTSGKAAGSGSGLLSTGAALWSGTPPGGGGSRPAAAAMLPTALSPWRRRWSTNAAVDSCLSVLDEIEGEDPVALSAQAWLESCLAHNGGSGGVSGSSKSIISGMGLVISELATAGSLRALRARMGPEQGPVDLLPLLHICRQVACGLSHLHRRRLAHGDLRAANVLLSADPTEPLGLRAMVADYGFSRLLLTGRHALLARPHGAPSHLAPEAWSDGAPCPAGDIFAFGLLLWEVAMGIPPWTGLTVSQILAKVVLEDRRPDFPAWLPRGYVQLVQACWARNPSSRPDLAAILQWLDELIMEHLPPEPVELSTWQPPIVRWPPPAGATATAASASASGGLQTVAAAAVAAAAAIHRPTLLPLTLLSTTATGGAVASQPLLPPPQAVAPLPLPWMAQAGCHSSNFRRRLSSGSSGYGTPPPPPSPPALLPPTHAAAMLEPVVPPGSRLATARVAPPSIHSPTDPGLTAAGNAAVHPTSAAAAVPAVAAVGVIHASRLDPPAGVYDRLGGIVSSGGGGHVVATATATPAALAGRQVWPPLSYWPPLSPHGPSPRDGTVDGGSSSGGVGGGDGGRALAQILLQRGGASGNGGNWGSSAGVGSSGGGGQSNGGMGGGVVRGGRAVGAVAVGSLVRSAKHAPEAVPPPVPSTPLFISIEM